MILICIVPDHFNYLGPILQLYKISSWLDIKDGTFKSTRSPEEKTNKFDFILKGSHALEMESQLDQVS